MLLNLWRRWSARAAGTSVRAIASGRRYRPLVEVLEDRCLPSLVTVTSTSDDPSDSGSLRYALNNATSGETIDFAPSVRTIDLSSKLNTTGLTVPVNLSIINDQGVGPVTIDGGGVLTVFTVGNVTALLSGLTITDGTAIYSPNYIGGDILNTGTLTINNCTVSNTSVSNYGAGVGVENAGTVTISESTFSNDAGSAILNNAGMATVSDSSISNNDSGAQPIQNYATMQVSDCTFSDNSANGAGAISNAGMLSVSNSTFSNNTAGEYGGAIYNGGVVVVSDSSFTSNSAASRSSGSGGAIYNALGTVAVTGTTFANNSAGAGGGGAIFNTSTNGVLTVNNCTFCYNSASDGGDGGAISNSGTLTIMNSSISDNTASGSGQGGLSKGAGGGVYIDSSSNPSSVTLDGVIVAGNVNTNSSTVPDDIAGIVGLGSADNLIGTGGGGGLLDGVNGNQLGVSVAEVGLGPLANNGGPTPTMAISTGSFAIGRGYMETTATTDQRGVARPIGQPSDVGAYQFSTAATVTSNPSSQAIAVGGDASFIAAANDGAPTPTNVQWQFSTDDGISFTNLGDNSTFGGVNSSTLTIADAPATLTGDEFRAVFSNASGLTATTTAAMLSVAVAISPVAGAVQSATVANVFGPVEALVTDDLGNPVPGASVTFNVVAGSSGASGAFTGNATVTTSADGIAIAPTLTAGHAAGGFTVTASISGIATPADFNLTNTPGIPAAVTAVGGTPQNTPIGNAYGTMLQAEVVDAYGNQLADVPITFAAPLAGPTGTFNAVATVPTNALGIATAPPLTANHLTGTFTVAATVLGVASAADFTLTNTAVPAAIKATGGNSQRAAVGTSYGVPLQARVTDTHGKPIAGITVLFELPSGASGTFAGSPAVVTNASGIATAPALRANTEAGRFTVDAWVSGVNTPASFTLTNFPLGPATVNAIAGTPQSAPEGKPYSTKLQAQVVDQYGNPISGAAVAFSAPAKGASGTFAGRHTAIAVTDASGVATVAIMADGVAGSFTVTAALSVPVNAVAPTVFYLTNLPPVAGALRATARRLNTVPSVHLGWLEWL